MNNQKSYLMRKLTFSNIIYLPILLLLSSVSYADQTIGNGAILQINAGDVYDMNCQALTISNGGTLNIADTGTLQGVSSLTIESGGTLNGSTTSGSILSLAAWVNNGTVSSIPKTIEFTSDCGEISVSGTGDTDGDGISDDLEGSTEVDSISLGVGVGLGGGTGLDLCVGLNLGTGLGIGAGLGAGLGIGGIGVDLSATIGIGDLDVDCDGIYNFLDLDSDGDGVDDGTEGTGDNDNNGVPDYLQPSVPTCTVTNTNDTGAGSLRAALTCSNADDSLNTISFNIPTSDTNYDVGTGVWTIKLSSTLLPAITTPVIINGTTATGASCGDLGAGTPHSIKIAITPETTANSAFSIGNGSTGTIIRGLSLYGFTTSDIAISQGSGGKIQCNYIGLMPDGVSVPATTAAKGIGMLSSSNILVGGSVLGQGNVISGHSADGINMSSADLNNITIQGNIIGLSADGGAVVPNRTGITVQTNANTIAIGGNIISGNSQRGVLLNQGGSDSTIQGNYIGTSINGSTDMGNTGSGIEIITNSSSNPVSNVIINSNVLSGNDSHGIHLNGDATTLLSAVSITNNTIGRNAGDTANLSNEGDGIRVVNATASIIGGTLATDANRIYAGGASSTGVDVRGTAEVAILGNRISESTKLGINLLDPNAANPLIEGVSANDAGDVDAGPNGLLNVPVFNVLKADGTNVITYDFNLDVPSNTDGYRIEFFRDNISGDTNGEAAEYLGSLDIAHAGGDLNFTGTFTANTTVVDTDKVTATATRKSATGFIETSEFSETRLAFTAVCGNNIVETGEFCDDANTAAGDGCSASCSIEANYKCAVDAGNDGTCDTTGLGSVILSNTAPTITSANTASVAENQTTVVTITATDAQLDNISYAITGGVDAAKFVISDASTGILTFVDAPNFEDPTQTGITANEYIVEVTASDDGFGALSSTAQSIIVTYRQRRRHSNR